MKQKYHQYTEWEDYTFGMWRKVSSQEEKKYLDEAIRFTGNSEEYGSWMMKVSKEWEADIEDIKE